MEDTRKIALIAVNSRTSHTNLALYYIKTILQEQMNTQSDLVELTINDNWKQVLKKLTVVGYDYYLFSVYIWNSLYIEELIPLLKQISPQSKIVLGGPEITYNLKKWERMNVGDILVQGQAESFIPYLFTYNKRIFRSPKIAIDTVPFPYKEEDFSNLEGRLVYYEASRGCLFNCAYCLSSCSDQSLEYREIGRVKKELKSLISIGPKIVKMVDRTFNANKEYAREIWQFLIDEKSPIPFHFELHPLFLDDEDFTLLEKAPEDLFFFEVGIQSTNDFVLSSVNRTCLGQKEKENIKKLCSLKNIHTHLDQIVGLPEDTYSTAKKSFNEILSFYPEEYQLGFLKILEGTSLAEKREAYKMVVKKNPPYEVIQTSTMSFSEMKEFYIVETDLGRYYNSHFFCNTIKYLMKKSASPWAFFVGLQSFSPQDESVKRWAVLGESLLHFGVKEEERDKEYLFDLLRLDWCPYASGQGYPPFLKRHDGEKIKNYRRNAYSFFQEKIPGFTKGDFNHSILFVPENSRLIEEMNHKALLFYRSGKGEVFEMDTDRLM